MKFTVRVILHKMVVIFNGYFKVKQFVIDTNNLWVRVPSPPRKI